MIGEFTSEGTSTDKSTLMLEHEGGLRGSLVVCFEKVLEINVERETEMLSLHEHVWRGVNSGVKSSAVCEETGI